MLLETTLEIWNLITSNSSPVRFSLNTISSPIWRGQDALFQALDLSKSNLVPFSELHFLLPSVKCLFLNPLAQARPAPFIGGPPPEFPLPVSSFPSWRKLHLYWPSIFEEGPELPHWVWVEPIPGIQRKIGNQDYLCYLVPKLLWKLNVFFTFSGTCTEVLVFWVVSWLLVFHPEIFVPILCFCHNFTTVTEGEGLQAWNTITKEK